LTKLEKNIAALTAEKAALEAAMGVPDFYQSGNQDHIAKTQQHYAALQKKLETAEASWLEAQEDYEAAAGNLPARS